VGLLGCWRIEKPGLSPEQETNGVVATALLIKSVNCSGMSSRHAATDMKMSTTNSAGKMRLIRRS
jgi:hypothetical protein